MVTSIIPEDVQKFILQNIDSVAQLEGLLLLRNTPARELSADAISEQLYITREETAELLNRLVARGLLAESTTSQPLYRYQPASPEIDVIVEHVADAYARYLVPVTHLVHSKSRTRIQEFADAFWIRKE